MTENSHPSDQTPRDITLDDLAQRYPDTADLVDQVVIETPPTPPPGGGGGSNRIMWGVVIPFFVSLAAGIATIWLVFFWPGITPVAAERLEQVPAQVVTEAPQSQTLGASVGKNWPE